MDLVLHTDASYRNDLDTGKFARMLDDPSQCYKFYWLEAILNLLPTEEGDISFEKIIDEMICDAWYSVTRYKLHLGPTIRGKCENAMERAINVINRDDQMSYASSKDEIMHGIEQHQAEIRADKLTLTINVPYRLLSYFLDMSDAEIANVLNMVRRSVAYRRTSTLKLLKELMEGGNR